VRAIQCPSCKKYTAPNRGECLSCGASLATPMLANKKGFGLGVAIWGVLVASVGMYGWFLDSNSGDNSQGVKEASYIVVHQDRIKARMKDPESARFRNVFVSHSLGGPLVCGEVNAKNSFGGYTGFQRFVSGGDQQVVDTDMAPGEMDSLWPQACSR